MSDDVADTVEDAAREVGQHPALEALARGGYAVNGVLHLILALIAVQIGIGAGGEADQAGALEAVQEAPMGAALLWVGVLGYAGLALWQMLEAAVGFHPGSDTASWAARAKDAAKGGVYAALAWTASVFAVGSSTDSGEQTSVFTGTMMSAPLGRVFVLVVGLGVLGVAGYHVHKGANRAFLEDLAGNAGGDLGRAVTWSGTIGYVAKGIALAVVGLLFGYAAWTADARESTGLDGALKTLAESTAGTAVVGVIAAGLLAYGLYSFARSRYARL